MIIVLNLFGIVTTLGCAQEPMKNQDSKITIQEMPKITIKGKIAYMKALGGYMVQGEVPRNEFIIVNQNPDVLRKLAESEKNVTIEGRLTRGADFLFIEKIDDKPYCGEKALDFK